jgi:hypothetical protein
MQCSFIKIQDIQDLIGYVSEYMLMHLKRHIKQLMYLLYADNLLWYGENQIIACLGKFHSQAGIIGAQKASI